MTDEVKSYDEIADEPFIINDTRLDVLPMDATLFSDNAVYGASFPRSRAVFAYRSKHAREKIILTLPINISVSPVLGDEKAIYSRKDGMKILTQLSNYPFCFIKSPRIESYVAPSGGISSEGFMLFGIEQITSVQDMSTPDVLFIEYHLVFCNYTPLTKGFKFKCKDGSVVDYPSSSDIFKDVFSNMGDNTLKLDSFLEDLKIELQRTDTQGGGYHDVSVPYGATILLSPHMVDVEGQQYLEEKGNDLSQLNPKDIKYVEISASKGDSQSTIQLLTEVEAKDRDRSQGNKEILAIGWSAITDLAMFDGTALQSIRMTRYNKFAKHFISAHKHPILQYMGTVPSKIEISFLTTTSSVYSTGKTSLIDAYTQLFNIVDYNATTYPAANAFNYLKIRSASAFAMGIEKVIPNQKFISSSSSKQGVESLNLTFIETNTEEFIKGGQVEQGRETVETSSDAAIAVINTFINHWNQTEEDDPAVRFAIGKIIKSLNDAMEAMAVEFSRGIPQTRFADQDRWDTVEDKALNDTLYYKNRISDRYADVPAFFKAFQERSVYRRVYIDKGKELASKELAGIRIDLSVKTGKTDTFGREVRSVDAGEASNFTRNGLVDAKISEAFFYIQHLANAGNSAAKAAVSIQATNSEQVVDASISNFKGTNYLDINYPGIKESQSINPMDFLQVDAILQRNDLTEGYALVSKGFEDTIDEIIQNKEKMMAASIGETNVAELRSVITKIRKEIREQSFIEETNNPAPDNFFGGSTLKSNTSSYGAVGSTYSTTTASGDSVDWNNPQNQKNPEAIVAIKKAVMNDTRIPNDLKDKWVYLLIQIAGVESGFNSNKPSSTGAVGIFQFTDIAVKDVNTTKAAVSGGNYLHAAQSAISLILKTMSVQRAVEEPVTVYSVYNIGQTGSNNVVKTIKGDGSLISKYGDKTINTRIAIGNQRASLVVPNDDLQTARNYVSFVETKMRPVLNHLGKNPSVQTSPQKQPGLKEETSKPVTLTREDIEKNYVKATLLSDDSSMYTAFKVESEKKTKQVTIRGLSLPIAPSLKEISIKGSKRVKYTEKGQPYGKEARSFIKSKLASGFYIERFSGTTGLSRVFDMNFQDIGLLTIQAGLALATPGSEYEQATSKVNTGYTKEYRAGTQPAPATFQAEMKNKYSAIQEGNEVLAAIVEAGTTPVYIDGTSFKELTVEIANKAKEDLKATLVRPSSVTNNYIPFETEGFKATSGYGPFRTTVVNGKSKSDYHLGVDVVPTSSNNNVVSSADGVVYESGYAGYAGNIVRIWHDKIGFSTHYFHLKSFNVRNGQSVKAGQVIGVMGATGRVTGAHLHYQVGFGKGARNYNIINPFKTTKLSEIPPFKNYTNPQLLKEYALHFMSKDYALNHAGVKLTPAMTNNRVYGGGDAAMAGPQSSFGDSSGTGVDYSGEAAIATSSSFAKDRGIDYDFSVYNQELIVKKQLDSIYYPYSLSLNTLFPVLKAYVTVGSDNEDLFLRQEIRLGFYFELNGIEAFKLACNNDENPVDLVRMTVANPSFVMTDDYAVTGKYMTSKMENIYGPDEIKWVADRIKLKPGNKLHIKAGYDNDPNKLITIFNGIITEISSSRGLILDLVCEGFGRELLATQIEPAGAKTAGGSFHNSSTGVIMGRSLLQDGITHFGTSTNTFQTISSITNLFSSNTDSDDKTDPEAKRLVTRWGGSIFNGSTGFGFYFGKSNIKQRLFTNIYAAEIDTLHPEFASRLINYLTGLLSLTEKAGYYYIFEGQTPWDACKEMEYRHPGTKVKPLFYDDRMTLFFGLKEQMYIARDLNPSYMASIVQGTSTEDTTEVFSVDYLKNRYKRMELVTKIHMANSNFNIISNGLSLNSSFNTGVNVLFFEDNEERQEGDTEDYKEFKMTMDDNLNFWEYRYKTISMPGTHGKYSSFMYGTTALRLEAEKMYGGKILLTGNPHIKAGDFIYIDDEINKMQGILKIRECIHTFSADDGYVTEITPGLYVEAGSFFYTTLFQRLAITAQMASAFTNVAVTETAFSSLNFKYYYEMFKTYKNLTESTNLEKINNGISYNTGGGFLVASILTFDAILGYAVIKATSKLGLNAVNIAKGAMFVKGGLSSLGSGFSFIAQQTASVYRSTKAIKNTGTLARLVAAFSRGKTVVTSWRLFKLVRNMVSLTAAFFLGSNPLGWFITAIGTFMFSYVDAMIQEATLTRQPLVFFPINYIGRPYTAGISGYRYNSWWESKKENLSRNTGYVTKGLTESSMTNPDRVSTIVLGWLNGSKNATLVGELKTIDETMAVKK